MDEQVVSRPLILAGPNRWQAVAAERLAALTKQLDLDGTFGHLFHPVRLGS
jgi:hypothetical protein